MAQKSLPKHQSPTAENQRARAPYNFVPLPDMIVAVDPPAPDHDVYWPAEMANTGYIDCSLTTLAPLYTRCMMNPDFFKEYSEKAFHELGKTAEEIEANQKKRAEFFHIDDIQKPVIPGSSLRGMLRSLVEIVSYSKVESVTDQQLVYRAVGDTTSHGERYRERIMRNDGNKRYTPLVQAGYIQQNSGGSWQIRPAQEIGGTTFARIRIDGIPGSLEKIKDCKNAAHIYIQPGPCEYQDVRGGFISVKFSKVLRVADRPGPGLIKGALARSGPMASKRTEAVVFPPDVMAKPISIPGDLEEAYRDQISREQETLLGKNGVLNEGQPVFYLIEKKKLIFFSHTMMMRLPYRQSPLDFVPEPLRKPEDIDLTEAIFGYAKKTGKSKARAYASRVSVSDAVLEPDQHHIWLKPEGVITPKILAGPKPTTFQHYLVQQRPDPQEAGRTRDGRPKFVKRLADYTASTPDETVLRGHKLYWHKDNVTLTDLQESPDKLREPHERDTQHTRIKPVAAGIRFKFRIHFENLSDKELGALLWGLTLPGEPGKQYSHSFGMGKPYGLGAVKLAPTLYLSDRKARYTSLFKEGSWQNATSVVAANDVTSFIARFDHFIRQRIGQEQQPSLASVERICMLLKLLEWPGPDKEQTRYMEIERQDATLKRGRVNEYKDRPVLPDPLNVTEQASIKGQPRTTVKTGSQSQPQFPINRPEPARKKGPITTQTPVSPTQSRIEPPVPATLSAQPMLKPEPELSQPTSEAEVKEGMYIEGRVVRVELSRVVLDIGIGAEATLPTEKVVPAVRDEAELRRRFPMNKKIRVWVSGRNKKGRIQLTMQRP